MIKVCDQIGILFIQEFESLYSSSLPELPQNFSDLFEMQIIDSENSSFKAEPSIEKIK